MEFGDLVRGVGSRHRDDVTAGSVVRGMSNNAITRTFGVSRETARRWRAGTQQPSAANVRKIREEAPPEIIAAAVLRSTRRVAAGRQRIRYDGSPDGSRDIGTVSGDSFFGDVADALNEGDLDQAEQLMSDGILGEYGKRGSRSTGGSSYRNRSPMTGLSIEDWTDMDFQ